MKILAFPQRSTEWYAAHVGRLTASNMRRVLHGSIKGWSSLVRELQSPSGSGFKSYAMDRGSRLEQNALANYELANPKEIVSTVGMVIHRDYSWLGCSPDALTKRGGVEIKCPLNDEKHMKTIVSGMPFEHKPQVQACIWICERDWWDFVSFDPRIVDPSKRYVQFRIWRDEIYIRDMEIRCAEFREFWLGRISMTKREMSKSDKGPSITNIPKLFKGEGK